MAKKGITGVRQAIDRLYVVREELKMLRSEETLLKTSISDFMEDNELEAIEAAKAEARMEYRPYPNVDPEGAFEALGEDMEKFFHDVEINDTGEILYNPLKIAVANDGRIFFEVHKDVYGKIMNMDAEARRLIESTGLSDQVNWQKVNQMLNQRSGVAEDITL